MDGDTSLDGWTVKLKKMTFGDTASGFTGTGLLISALRPLRTDRAEGGAAAYADGQCVVSIFCL